MNVVYVALALRWVSRFMQLPGSCLWDVFHSRCRLRTGAGELDVKVVPIDPIVLPSGRVVVGDPLVDIYYAEPLARPVQAGRYSVRLATAAGLGGAVASLVRLLPGTPVCWEPTDPERHGVDSGTSGLTDHELQRRVARKSAYWSERHTNRCMDALDADGLWANRRLHRETGGNLLLFRTATGDGYYSSFWGLSENGDALCLVTRYSSRSAAFGPMDSSYRKGTVRGSSAHRTSPWPQCRSHPG